MKKLILPLITLLFVFGTTQAQYVRCGTDENMAVIDAMNPSNAAARILNENVLREMIAANPDYRVSNVVTIPVVFHIIYNNASQNIPDARIYEQLNVLNQDYGRTNIDASNTRSIFQPVAANTQIQFCLAQRTPQGTATTGILRISTTSTSLPNNPNTISPEWDHINYLNIYVGNLTNGILGYSNFPPGVAGNDHAVLLYSAVGGPNVPGTANPYHLGRTATHEIGHWLHLYHTFQSGCAGLNANNCANAGDMVCDTPPVSASTFGCPVNTPNSCTETAPFPAPFTSDMVDQFENYMDYTDDGCMNMFSSGQASRMNGAITQLRAGLLASNGCVPVGLNEVLDQSYLSVMPNPSNGIFELRFQFPVNTEVEILISDMTGRQIFSEIYSNSVNHSERIDLSAKAAGVYQLLLKSKEGYMVKQLVITKD